ncbi:MULTISPECIES: MerR family transcriptional regulator [Catenuloplanes]|uniref:DNA-binding transcriptional MerR regulator n=1 Tax=Catenuloplanes niger TaxID=587534 RepID=A0AAE3ZVL7_9ACTN|nr:MerR family transcriptional regulator [Catenuloplanes niger]MDR7326611.1 DNA-binding transcriptional MerR regulator [Catenuloplanes niger]
MGATWTIGRLAGYAGVTIKAVRVYHDRGLLPEPPRDASGYRRYGAEHAVQLVKIRTLAEAGVPLARIRGLLDADPDRLAAAIEEIDDGLRRRADQIARTRRRLARLRGGDRLYVPDDVASYLDRLREIGVSERTVLLERDLWIMLAPYAAAAWLTGKLAALADPEFRALYLDHDAAFDWSPDDPRLPALAARTRDWSARRPPDDAPPDLDTAALAAVTTTAASPAWARIAELAG